MDYKKSQSELRKYLLTFNDLFHTIIVILFHVNAGVLGGRILIDVFKSEHIGSGEIVAIIFFAFGVIYCLSVIKSETKYLLQCVYFRIRAKYDEETIADFESADTFFQNKVKIGNKYIFVKGGINEIHIEDCCDIKVSKERDQLGVIIYITLITVYKNTAYNISMEKDIAKKDYYKFAKKLRSGNSKLIGVLSDVRKELINLDVLDDPEKKAKEKAEKS